MAGATCSECGRDGGTPGLACRHCGQVALLVRRRSGPYRPGPAFRLSVAVLIILAMALVVGAITSNSPRLARAIAREPPATTPVERAARVMPPSERDFIVAIDRGRTAFETGSGEAEKAAARPERGRAVCQAVPYWHVFAWTGLVDTVSSGSDGTAAISIELAPHLHIVAGAAALAAAVQGTAIERDSPILPMLHALQPGQAVAFSGSFLSAPRRADECLGVLGTTDDAAMTEPAFPFRLFGIAPFPSRPPIAPAPVAPDTLVGQRGR